MYQWNASQNFFALTSGAALKRLIKSGRIAQLPMQVSLSKPETRPDQMCRSSVPGSLRGKTGGDSSRARLWSPTMCQLRTFKQLLGSDFHGDVGALRCASI